MSVTGDLGISPVLLQAISQTLTSSEHRSEKQKASISRMMERKVQPSSKVVSHLLQGMNEPVSGLLPLGATTESGADGEREELNAMSLKQEEVEMSSLHDRLAAQLASRVASAAVTGGSVAMTDVSMVNVLTALASQHIKANIKQEAQSVPVSITHHSVAGTSADVVVRTGDGGADDRPQPQIIIYYNNEAGSVPSPANDVVVGELDSDGQNYRVVVHGDGVGARVQTVNDQSVQFVGEGAGVETGVGTIMAADSNSKEGIGGLCPVCTDKISGYHYGVFTCESCKGFFKRTVQNKKSFLCHKAGDCEVNVYNRKKCPACRFAKCLTVGMRLEAIRPDRTRGGRSSYDGCSPHGKPRPSPMQRKKRAGTSDIDDQSRMGQAGRIETVIPEEDGKSHRQLVAILNHSNAHGQKVPDGAAQRVPELLTDIMNLEPLLADDDIPQEAAIDETQGQQPLYDYLMQLTELRLYKLVRWARNLPQFGAISTDDQILLLQNCWSDLLALGVCWRSINMRNVLNISTTRSILLEEAQALGFGDVVSRLLNITQNLRRLRVDQYEYVALKVLLLITPDVKGLKDPGKIREYQEKLSEALMEYTTAHYVTLPSKFGEMLLRLPELARISFISKETLLTALPPAAQSCGLLVELLKGENAVKD